MSFAARYGPVALVCGASEGLGAAFAEAITARGLDLVLMARRAEVMESVAAQLRDRVKVRCIVCDLGSDTFDAELRGIEEEVGLAIYNAAYSYTAPLLDRPLEDTLRVVDVNVRGPLKMVHALATKMRARKRGGVVLMSSLAGFQGAPRLAAYGASKAFNTILGESLHAELAPDGVDVLVSCAGAIRTPNYLSSAGGKEAPGILDATEVANTTLDALGSGPLVVPGAMNKLASFVMRRALPRSLATAIMARSTRDLG